MSKRVIILYPHCLTHDVRLLSIKQFTYVSFNLNLLQHVGGRVCLSSDGPCLF